MGRGLHIHMDRRGLALRGGGPRSLLPPRRRLGACHGDLATGQARCAAASLRSRQPIYQRAVPAPDGVIGSKIPLKNMRGCCGRHPGNPTQERGQVTARWGDKLALRRRPRRINRLCDVMGVLSPEQRLFLQRSSPNARARHVVLLDNSRSSARETEASAILRSCLRSSSVHQTAG